MRVRGMLFCIVLLLCIVSFSGMTFGASSSDDNQVLEQGKKLEREGNFQDAAQFFGLAAEKGNTEAQYHLGRMYMDGRGVFKNDSEAAKWLFMAADKAHTKAEYSIGVLYDEGRGVTQDTQEAFMWFSKAAAKGLAEAQCKLGDYYYSTDRNESEKWYLKAAQQGNPEAQYALGVFYINGNRASDMKTAAQWIRKAAEQGYTDAEYFLGMMYDNGDGVSKSKKNAVKWYTRAAEKGHTKSRDRLAVLEPKNPKWQSHVARKTTPKNQPINRSQYTYNPSYSSSTSSQRSASQNRWDEIEAKWQQGDVDAVERLLIQAAEEGDSKAKEAIKTLESLADAWGY